MTAEKDLLRFVNNLARVRKEQQDQADKVEALLEALEKLQAHKDYVAACAELKELKELESEAYERVREAALKVFQETAAKQLMNGAVEVKEYVVVRYPDKKKTEAWIRENARLMLKVDWRSFERTVKADGSVPEEIAVLEKEPRASVSTDLSKYLDVE